MERQSGIGWTTFGEVISIHRMHHDQIASATGSGVAASCVFRLNVTTDPGQRDRRFRLNLTDSGVISGISGHVRPESPRQALEFLNQ
jgi:hypothetical protein